MPALNVSLPGQLKNWVAKQVEAGRYSSASDYLRDLIREDLRNQRKAVHWLANQLEPLLKTPSDKFVSVTAEAVKKRARRRIKG